MESIFTSLKIRWKILRAFIYKEILQILRDKRMRIVLFIAPLMQLMVFGIALSTETRNIKLAIFTIHSSSVGMWDLYNRALGTKWFIPAQVSGQEPFEWVQSGEADAVLVEPLGGLDRRNANGVGTVQLLINAQNSVRAQAIENYMKAISAQVFLDPKLNLKAGLSFDIRSLYNPTFETSMFMVPGVLSLLVCLVTILLTSMAVAREREVGTMETLIAAPLDGLDLLLGKTVPFIILGSIQTPLILSFAVFAFGLPIRGPLLMLAIASLLMIIATVSIGLLISTISKNQQQAMLGGFLYLFPSFLLSGLLFPIENMPLYIQPLAYVNPLTHYIDLLRNILLIGGELNYFIFHSFVLFVIGNILGYFAYRRFQKMLV